MGSEFAGFRVSSELVRNCRVSQTLVSAVLRALEYSVLLCF